MKYGGLKGTQTLQIAGHHINKCQDIVLFGTGKMGNLVIKALKKQHKNIIYAIDNDPQKWGRQISRTAKIISPAEGVKISSSITYIIANINHSDEIAQQLLKAGISECQIIVCNNSRKIEEEIRGGKYRNENKHFVFDIPKKSSVGGSLYSIWDLIRAVYYRALMLLFHPPDNKVKKYKISICAIFRDEAVYLKEWIEYHKMIGIEHFYMYNNFSADNYKSILQPYISNGEIDLIDWPYPQGQMSAYKDCIEKFRDESQWIGFIDLDEFVVPLKDHNIYSFLQRFEKNCGSVLIYWKMFGTSGLRDRDVSGLVIEDFTISWKKHFNIGKCFINTNYDCIFDGKNSAIHHRAWTTYKGITFPPVNEFGYVSFGSQSNDLVFGHNLFPVQINHYYIKSYEEGLKKKKKPDVYFKKNEREYLEEYELKNTEYDINIYKYLTRLKNILLKEQ